jgi:hypothetical protein
VTAEDAALNPTATETDPADEAPLYCYRHPKSETWVRCGRCDQPICPKCAVQGPVGFRCRECGRPKNDPLTRVSPLQLLLAGGISLGGGAIIGYVGGSIGFFSVIIAFFGGGIIAEALARTIGYKRGPLILSVLFGGILAGVAVGSALEIATFMAGVPEEAGLTVGDWVISSLPWILLGAGAACAGAWSRIR